MDKKKSHIKPWRERIIYKRGIYFYTKLSKIFTRCIDGLKILRKIMKNHFHCHTILANTCWDNGSAIIKQVVIGRCSYRRTNIICIAENNSVEAVKEYGDQDSFLIFNVFIA